MRKKTVNHLADTIFWYLLYFLPIMISILSSITSLSAEGFWSFWLEEQDYTSLPFSSVIIHVINGAGMFAQGPVYDTLVAIFDGVDGIFPVLGADGFLIQYMNYFVTVYLMHLMVDFILFIPRLCHKWMKSFTQGD